MSEENKVLNPNGLTDEQCKEIHGHFMTGLAFWVGAAFFAHLLAWQWMPWFPN